MLGRPTASTVIPAVMSLNAARAPFDRATSLSVDSASCVYPFTACCSVTTRALANVAATVPRTVTSRPAVLVAVVLVVETVAGAGAGSGDV